MNRLLLSAAFAAVAMPLAHAQCLPNPGSVLGTAPDAIYPIAPIGFAFPFNGTTYTDVHVSDHGIFWLSNGGTPPPPTAVPLVYNVLLSDFAAFGPAIAPFWSDHNPGTSPGSLGAVWIDNTSGTECVITWVDMQTWFNQLPKFTFQATLRLSGEIEFAYGDTVNNYGSSFAPNAIVGVTPGAPALLPPPSNLSASPVVTANPSIYEEFSTPGTFDLASRKLTLTPLSPGWLATTSTLPCAAASSYGSGCYSSQSSFYQLFADAAVASTALTGNSMLLVPTPTGYVAQWLPGTAAALYVPPTSPVVLPTGDDGAANYALTTAIPSPYGPVSSLTVSGNAIVAFNAATVTGAWVPSAATFVSQTYAGVFCWHDYNQTEIGSGPIVAEQVGGVAYVTFDGVESYSTPVGPNPSTLQFQFDSATGNITVVWLSIDNNTTSAFGSGHLIGFKGPGVVPDNGSINLATALPITTGPDSPGLALTSGLPLLGSPWVLTTSNIDPVSPVAITFFGLLQVDPGLDLGFLGAPGCRAYITPVVGNIASPSIAGTATASLPIPNNPALAGAQLTAQSICLTLQNALNLLTSNGRLGILGN